MTAFRKFLQSIFWVLVCNLLFISVDLQADPNDDVRLKIRVGDVYAYSGEQRVPIPVYLTNYIDTVASFSFDFWKGPFCGSWREEIDTVGSLIAGWPVVDVWSISWLPPVFRVLGDYQSLPIDDNNLPLYPQQSETPAFTFYFDVATITDTASRSDAQIGVINRPVNSKFVWDIHNVSIGSTYQLIIDTSYLICEMWDEIDPELCLHWERASGLPYDSIKIDTGFLPTIDTNIVKFEPGTVTIVRCGNFDGSSDNKINLADITAMIAFVYLNGDEPPVERAANVDGTANGAVNLADITKLISHVYLGSGPLACE